MLFRGSEPFLSVKAIQSITKKIEYETRKFVKKTEEEVEDVKSLNKTGGNYQTQELTEVRNPT